jgi:6-phosphogluconolactonase
MPTHSQEVHAVSHRPVALAAALLAAAADSSAQSPAPPAPAGKVRVYVGTYTNGDSTSKGIYRLQLDLATGALSPEGEPAPSVNPSFLAFHPSGKYLYAVNETGDAAAGTSGNVSAYSIDPKTGALTLLNQQPSAGADPCHLTVDKAGTHVLVANYSGATSAVLPIDAAGRLGPATQVVKAEGHGRDPKRQEGPHPHSVNLDAANRYAFIADLGTDKVNVFKYDPATGTLTPNDPPAVSLVPGSGPRHFAFHPDGAHAYVINELSSMVTVFDYEAATGRLREAQTVTTLPPTYEGGANSTAEIVVHPNGRFAYGSNRGHDSIVVYSVNGPTGKLRQAEHERTLGKTPRNFAIDPTGTYLLAANQGSDTVAVFRIDPESGRLSPVGEPVKVPRPVCLRMVKIG